MPNDTKSRELVGLGASSARCCKKHAEPFLHIWPNFGGLPAWKASELLLPCLPHPASSAHLPGDHVMLQVKLFEKEGSQRGSNEAIEYALTHESVYSVYPTNLVYQTVGTGHSNHGPNRCVKGQWTWCPLPSPGPGSPPPLPPRTSTAPNRPKGAAAEEGDFGGDMAGFPMGSHGEHREPKGATGPSMPGLTV